MAECVGQAQTIYQITEQNRSHHVSGSGAGNSYPGEAYKPSSGFFFINIIAQPVTALDTGDQNLRKTGREQHKLLTQLMQQRFFRILRVRRSGENAGFREIRRQHVAEGQEILQFLRALLSTGRIHPAVIPHDRIHQDQCLILLFKKRAGGFNSGPGCEIAGRDAFKLQIKLFPLRKISGQVLLCLHAVMTRESRVIGKQHCRHGTALQSQRGKQRQLHCQRTAPEACEIIENGDAKQLCDFTLSIGVVSNHGNWFTAGNQNKEMKVLAQSYDWLLFLTDEGLAEFIIDLLRSPRREYKAVKEAFIASYPPAGGPKAANAFTKKHMEQAAHKALDAYFAANIYQIERWFNVISPEAGTLHDLKHILVALKNKDWRAIL